MGQKQQNSMYNKWYIFLISVYFAFRIFWETKKLFILKVKFHPIVSMASTMISQSVSQDKEFNIWI